jgi:hypothetical protein
MQMIFFCFKDKVYTLLVHFWCVLVCYRKYVKLQNVDKCGLWLTFDKLVGERSKLHYYLFPYYSYRLHNSCHKYNARFPSLHVLA